MESDEDLLRRARAGDAGAFGELVEAHQDRVYNLAFRMLGRREAAEDLAQEVFLRAFREIGRFRGDAKVSTWLYTITVNCCRDYLKSPRRRLETTGPESLDERGDAGPGPYETFRRGEKAARLEAALAELNLKYREAFLLRCVEGLEFKEIARVIGQSESGAKMRVARALAKLREMLHEG